MTCVLTQSETMTGFGPQKLPRPKATASGFSPSHGISGFSFHTEPSQGQNSGSFWNETSDGQQYSQDSMHSPNGFDAFTSFSVTPLNQHGQSVGQEAVTRNRQQWNTSPTQLESEELSRLPSQDSTGAQSEGLELAPYDQTGSTRLFPNISQVSYHMSSGGSDITGRSSPVDSGLYTPTQPDLQAFDVFHRDSIIVSSNTDNVSLNAGPSFTLFSPADETYGFLSNGPNNQNSHLQIGTDSVIYNPSAIMDSPTMWEDSTTYLESHRSSPVMTEEWTIAPSHITTSPRTTPLDYSPSLEGLSPKYAQDYPEPMELPPYTTGDRVLRKPVGPRQSKVVSDLAAASRNQRLPGTSEASDESLKFVGRSNLELDNTARDHPLYQNVSTKADGLYHCPWEGKDSCPHKPEKLKCNYDKFVDSHLKPYRCKVVACENSRFSSTACLLRHEREAHAMHGHGDKPYLCTHEGCERSVPGNGFPRHWNLRDHMKRVHNDPGPSKSNASGSPPPSNGTSNGPTRSKKRKADTTDSSVEKNLKRVATPPVAAIQEPSLIDRYHQSEQKLLETVKQLHDPKNPKNMALLRNASDCLKVMAQMTQRVNNAPVLGRPFSSQGG